MIFEDDEKILDKLVLSVKYFDALLSAQQK